MLYWIPLFSRHAVQRTKDPPPPPQRAQHSTTTTSKQPALLRSAAFIIAIAPLKLYYYTIIHPQPWPTKMKLPPLSLTMGLECAKVGIFSTTYSICNHVVVVGGEGICRRRGASATCVVSILPRRSIILIRRRRPTMAHAWP